MVFQIAIKNNVMKNIKNMEIQDQDLLNNLLYNTSVVNPAILKKTEMKINLIILLEIMIVIDIVKTTHTIVIDIAIMTDTEATVENIHKTTIDLILDKDITRDPKVHIRLDLHMTTIIKEELHPNFHIDHHIGTTLITDKILDQDIDLAHNHKESLNVIKENLEDTELRSNHRNSQEVRVKVKVTKDQLLILISVDPTLDGGR